MTAIRLCLAIALALSAAMADAHSNFPPTESESVWPAANDGRFVVSAVLRKEGESGVIKLVQSFVLAATSDAALTVFTKQAGKAYPGYSVIDTIITALPASCGYRVSI
ncbi:hypothetical protein [Cupriavidus sp. L7L]|uniref:hypothetical protein n=1 Tax=Cupriavidus sp. L7L TaxID=2546443 RepID=UPI001055BF9B|nr:hypothetical protein [Cupriavidus sp. L7L]TDF55102.1 hypothetical protein E1J61_36590 [Cupriavidus sp. L7L]